MNHILHTIKDSKPLVHQITNFVTICDCARITRYWGALPVMTDSIEDVGEMACCASALVLNIGTLQAARLQVMLVAGERANQCSVPVILDPVGVGGTHFYTESAQKLLNTIKVTVIKGNPGEISILAGEKGIVKGVESIGHYHQIGKTGQRLAQMYQSIVVATGAEDIVTDGNKLYQVSNGHPLLSTIVGTGCMLASTIAVFCSVNKHYLEASLDAVAAFGLAAEIASKKAKYPESFRVKFMDVVAKMDDSQLDAGKKIKSVFP
jgi:hydroxyethylthiazole kinase